MRYKILFSAILILGVISLSFDKTSGEKMTAGLLLTFDDRNILQWEKQIPLFEKYDAHVTFFIDHFDKLTPDQIAALKRLKEAGHAIGCHGMRHRDAVKFSDEYSLEKYIYDEIIPAIELMKENGFSPTSFAYPVSSRNKKTDNELLKYFNHIRSGYPVQGTVAKTERFFVKAEDAHKKRLFWGVSFHPHSDTDVLVIQVKEAIRRIIKNEELLVLYAHDIRNKDEYGPKNFITTDALEEILIYSKKNKIKLYSFDELPQEIMN